MNITEIKKISHVRENNLHAGWGKIARWPQKLRFVLLYLIEVRSTLFIFVFVLIHAKSLIILYLQIFNRHFIQMPDNRMLVSPASGLKRSATYITNIYIIFTAFEVLRSI